MSVLDRKLLRELLLAWGMLVAITSIMGIGIAAYVALQSAYRNLTTALSSYYAQCRMADFSIEVKKVPIADLEPIRRLAGIVDLRPRIQFLATVDLESVVEPLNGIVLSLPNERRPVINDVILRRGSYFTDRRDQEVIVNEAFARRHGLHPGMSIHLLLNNQRQELFIVGTAISSEFTYLVGPGSIVPDAKRFGVFYLKQTYAEEIFDFQGAANQIVGTLSPEARRREGEILRQAELLLEDYGVFSTVPLKDQPSNRFIANEIQGLRAFGVINPAIFLAVAALILNVLMSRLAEQQRVVIGTLKALGYENRQVFWHFIKFGLAVGVVGGGVGCALGYWISTGMTGMYLLFFQFPQLASQLYADILGQGVMISLACALAGSVHGARGVLRLEPAEAMRPKPPPQGGMVFVERWTWLWSRLGFATRMTIRNVVRNRFRTASGIFAAAMGAAVSVNALMLVQAIRHMVDFQFELVQRSDVDLTFKDEQGFDVVNELRHLPGVEYLEPQLDVACTLTNGPYSKKTGIVGLVEHARLTMPRDLAGNRLRVPSAGLLLSRKLAELLHVERGGEVVMTPTQGRREPRTLRVEAIADSYIGMAAYAQLDTLSHWVGEEQAFSSVQLLTRSERSLRTDLYRELKQMPAIQGVIARADTIENVNETLIKNQTVFIGLLVLFAGIIFFGSVLNASLINLAERQREVATLRVLGYGPWQIGGLFARESLATNFIGTLLGLPLGYLLNVGITIAYDTEMFRIPVVEPGGVMLFTVVIGTGFALAAQGFVQRTIFRLDWLEALKIKE